MITERIITIPLYRHKVKVVVTDDIKEAKQKYIEIPDNSAACALNYGNTSAVVVTPNNLSEIVHEVIHVKNYIWTAIGYSPIADNDEPDAYLVSYIFEKVMNVVASHIQSKKNKKKKQST